MSTIGDSLKSRAKDVEILKNDIAIFKNLIKERKHSLDLVRELLSNAGAKEVGATKIEISYTKDREGHIFEIKDDGCGMNYTGRQDMPMRLDRFLGLGMSAIVGEDADEFSWKGLGSKLAYQSRRVEIESRVGHPRHKRAPQTNQRVAATGSIAVTGRSRQATESRELNWLVNVL